MCQVNLDKIRAIVFFASANASQPVGWAKIVDCFNSLPRWTNVLSSSLVSQNPDFISKILPRKSLVDSIELIESRESLLLES